MRKLVVLTALALVCAGCGSGDSASDADIAVCDAYQGLADAWPSTSEEVLGADDIWGSIETAAEGLIAAAETAGDTEIGAIGLAVGTNAFGYYDRQSADSSVRQGFVPFFTERFLGAEGLASLCNEIGATVVVPGG